MKSGTDRGHDLWQIEVDGSHAVLTLRGDWSLANAARLPSSEAIKEAVSGPVKQVTIREENLGRWDTILAAVLYSVISQLNAQGVDVDKTSLSDDLLRLIALTESKIDHHMDQASHFDIFEQVGKATLRQWFNLLVISSSVYYFLRSSGRAITGQGEFRWVDFATALEHSSVNALPIITIVSVLMGSILAFVGSIQLQAFGAEIFIADTVGIAVFREMAAIITAIVMAGHTGAAFASHLATMKVNEEVDALRTLGLSPHDYLAVPRVLALALALPMLYLYAALMTLVGSMLVANLTLDLSPVAYLTRTVDAIPVSYIFLGIIKSLTFGVLIGLVSCHIGLHAGRSAEAVGQAATQAVVVSILGIIVIDSLFAIASILFGF